MSSLFTNVRTVVKRLTDKYEYYKWTDRYYEWSDKYYEWIDGYYEWTDEYYD